MYVKINGSGLGLDRDNIQAGCTCQMSQKPATVFDFNLNILIAAELGDFMPLDRNRICRSSLETKFAAFERLDYTR